MSPRDLDAQVCVRRLLVMDELLRVLATIDVGADDDLAQLALERILTQLVDLAGDINGHVAAVLLGTAPGSARESFVLAGEAGVISPAAVDALLPSVGLRSVLTHEYVEVDRERVRRAAPLALEAYSAYVAAVRDWLRVPAPRAP